MNFFIIYFSFLGTDNYSFQELKTNLELENFLFKLQKEEFDNLENKKKFIFEKLKLELKGLDLEKFEVIKLAKLLLNLRKEKDEFNKLKKSFFVLFCFLFYFFNEIFSKKKFKNINYAFYKLCFLFFLWTTFFYFSKISKMYF